ncbi:MAG: hypothetical protein Kow0074_07690 [Candidatus Zixiibacteriota bacterium]
MNYDLFISPAAVGRRDESVQRAWAVPGTASGRTGQDVAAATAAVRVTRESASDPLKTEDVSNAVAAFNDVFEQADVSVRYRIDEHTNDLVISLVDTETDKVLRQMPPEAILKMRQRLEELLGVLFDTMA